MKNDEKIKQLKKHLMDVLSLFVACPQDLAVESVLHIDTYKVTILCHRADKGLLIGSGGDTYHSIRDFVTSWASQQQVPVELMPVDLSRDGQRVFNDPSRRDWATVEQLMELLTRLRDECLRFPDAAELSFRVKDGVANLKLRLSQSEKYSRYKLLKKFFETIMPIIGVANNLTIKAEVVQDMPEIESAQQPAENLGRFSR